MAKIYRTEIEETLMLLGCPDVADLDRSWVNYPPEWDRLGSSSSQPEGPTVRSAAVGP